MRFPSAGRSPASPLIPDPSPEREKGEPAPIARLSPPALNLAHVHPRQPPRHCACPNRLDCRRHRGQPRPLAEGARRGCGVRRRHGDGAGTVPRRLSARGSGAEAGVSGGVPHGFRGPARGTRRTAARLRWSACPGSKTANSTMRWRSSTAAGSRRCGSRSICPTTACSTRSGCSRRVRRRADRRFAGARRRADLRGHLGPRAGGMHRRDGRRNSAGRQRVPL